MSENRSKLSQWLGKNRITETAKPAAKKAEKPVNKKPATKTVQEQKPEPKTGKPKTQQRGGRGGRPPQKKIQKTNHDPWADKPTHEKRDKFHVTNTLAQKNMGDIRVVPLGGMEQVGSNCMFLEWGDDIILIDTGFLFPDPEHLGIDVLVPDVRYLVKNKHKIKGIIYTHGHLDHIGAVPYMVPELGFPNLYASRLTKELILANSDEFGIAKKLKITECTPRTKLKLGKFQVEFFHVNHSIPDSLGIVVNTPYGAIVHTSDFKVDHNPSDDQPSDLIRIASIGHKGVVLGMVDSTNAMKDGHTKSEHVIEERIAKVIKDTPGRLLVTTFASSVGRVAKIVEAAERHGRTVFLSGRSMEKNIAIARKLNYLKCKDRTVRKMNREANKMDQSKVLILCTGSQGEELAALTRMAAGKHKDVKLKKEDTILFSSSPIPGNEVAIVKVKNNLSEIGLKTINHMDMDIYVSGHGYKEEIKTVTALLNPKYVAPIHGEMYMRYGARDMLMDELGFSLDRTHIMKNGQGVVINKAGVRMMTEKEQIPATMNMYELGYKVPHKVLQERQAMGEYGLTVVTILQSKGKIKKVDILSRGYKTVKHNTKLWDDIEKTSKDAFVKLFAPESNVKNIQDQVAKRVRETMTVRGKDAPMVECVIYDC